MQAKEDVEIFMKNDLMDKYPHIKNEVEGSFNLD
jgi:hypothetical protein